MSVGRPGAILTNVSDDCSLHAFGHGQHTAPPRLAGRDPQDPGRLVQVGNGQIGDFRRPEAEIAHAESQGVVTASYRRGEVEGGEERLVLGIGER